MRAGDAGRRRRARGRVAGHRPRPGRRRPCAGRGRHDRGSDGADPMTDVTPGYFGRFGGQFVPEALSGALAELEQAWTWAREDDEFQAELDRLRRQYGGRPTPLYLAARLSRGGGLRGPPQARGPRPHRRRTSSTTWSARPCWRAHMGKPRLIAETGAGQHGVATRDRGGPVRARLHRLHGRRGLPAPAAQRHPHAAARGRGRARRVRHAHAQGRDQRGHAGLGHQRRPRPTT